MSDTVCLVCLKTVQSFDGESLQVDTTDTPILTKFLKFVENYLQISPTTKIIPTGVDTFCERCELAVVNPICQVYLELLSAQLRLSWELEQLGKLMKNAKCSTDKQSELENVQLLARQLGMDSVGQLEEFRNALARKCHVRRQEVLPDVVVGPRIKVEVASLTKVESWYDDHNDLEDHDSLESDDVDPLNLHG
ncbi:hypothetical protein Ocin01_13357 [Orchesella cincta]|uniref:Uncharacterized protein n=1 Tax=Orchesella cincta TaxID=48709 RepID=A0A1D2MJV4_ORCCI|nr:hypothetical protein Ocin01_13357 [Orchesella cincta]